MNRKTLTLAGWLLAMALVGAMPGHAAAQDTWHGGFVFREKPKMNYIPNTDVYYNRKASGFDLYRYANTWFLVDNGTWYQADDWRGPYMMVDFGQVPDEVQAVPGNYRRFWVARFEGDREHHRDHDLEEAYEHRDKDKDLDKHHDRDEANVPEDTRVWPGSFESKPSLHNITASGVYYSRHAANGMVDFYRFRGDYYLVDSGEWFRADSWRGPFFSISATSVPREVLRVPMRYRRHWAEPASE